MSTLSTCGWVSELRPPRPLQPYQHLPTRQSTEGIFWWWGGCLWDWWHGPSPSVDATNNRPIPSSSAVCAFVLHQNLHRPTHLPPSTIMLSLILRPPTSAANKNNMKRKWEIQQPIRTNDRGRMMQQPTTFERTINWDKEVWCHHLFSAQFHRWVRALFDQCNISYQKFCILLLKHKQIQIQLTYFAAKRIHYYTTINKFEYIQHSKI